MTAYLFERYAAHHERADFDCGVEILNRYLRERARQDDDRDAARLWIMVETPLSSKIAGYYTLCTTSVNLDGLPPDFQKRIPRYPSVPAFLIGRLARDLSFKGTGKLLLMDAIQRCVRQSNEIAGALIAVDAKDEGAVQFYTRFGFRPLSERRLFLPMATARSLIVS